MQSSDAISFGTLKSSTKNIASMYIKPSLDLVKELRKSSERKWMYVCMKVCNSKVILWFLQDDFLQSKSSI